QFQSPDRLGEVQADAAGTHDADDGGRTGVGFEIVEDLARQHGEDLGQDAEAYAHDVTAAGRGDPVDRLAVGGLDRFREELAEAADVGGHDGQRAGEGSEAHDIDPDQCPDQDVDAADRVERTPGQEAHDALRGDVARGEQAD